MTAPPAPAFLPAWMYRSAELAVLERRAWAPRFWHPITAASALPEGYAQAFDLLGLPLLLSRTATGPQAFLNRCPHRAVPLLEPRPEPRACRRLVCPYHGWTYDLDGQLLAAAREGQFEAPFSRADWPLERLACRELAGLLWVAIGAEPLPLEQQLDLVLAEAGALLQQPRRLLARQRLELRCNWKLAHDNTLDDYHVAIAHPTTLHREQGPVRHYRHAFSRHGSLLATPWPGGGEFLTFGLAPWTHLLLWPDGRLALIAFPPIDPGRCALEVWLLAPPAWSQPADAWLAELLCFLEEDRRLVEAAQVGYGNPEPFVTAGFAPAGSGAGFVPGPPHRMERRILQQQQLYRQLLGAPLVALSPPEPPGAARWPSPG